MSLPKIPPFKPHPLLRGGNRQTIAGVYLPNRLFRRRIRYRATQHVVDLCDGDQIVLHDDCPHDWRPGGSVALLVHGLGGCHGSPYMVRIAEKLSTRGVRVFRKDLRGWGAGARIATGPFHAARTEDITAALEAIHRTSPQSPIALIGFSLGANMILKLLGDAGRTGRRTYATAALAIAPPIDLMRCCEYLDQGLGRLYDRKYAKYLWNHLRDRRDIVPAFEAALRKAPARRIYEFDERLTAPMGGFDSVAQYYETASAIHVLDAIDVPTQIISARDDPIVPGSLFDNVQLSKPTRLYLTDHGGHMGFIAARNGEPDRRWMDWRVVDFATQIRV